MAKKRPDVILLDYEMPVCDGKQTLEMIRSDEDTKDIPVIFLTGLGDMEHIKSVLALKPAAYILKPANKDSLMEKITAAAMEALRGSINYRAMHTLGPPTHSL